MFKNYLLLSFKVLKRKPFYTFISLFGISFTLMTLMLLTSMGDAMFGSNAPMTDLDRMVFLSYIEQYTPFYDTIRVVDSVLMDSGVMRYDTTETTQSSGRMMNGGLASFYFLDKHLRGLEDLSSYTFFSNGSNSDTYLNGRKVTLSTMYADAAYWDVFDFRFHHGAPFGPDDVTGASRVAVMTSKAANDYFGSAGPNIIGQEIQMGDNHHRVVGIVDRPLMDNEAVSADVFLPVTTINPKEYDDKAIDGSFTAVFKATSRSKKGSVGEQLKFLADNFDMSANPDFEKLGIHSGTHLEVFAEDLLGMDDEKAAVRMLFLPLLIMVLLFLALPLINLINLSVSRIWERQSEISVRKAFGADGRNILYQFLLENLVLTFIGGVMGLVLAVLVIWFVNTNDLLGGVLLGFSPKVFLYFLLLIFGFGLLSGLLPAYRMSRTNIATSLR